MTNDILGAYPSEAADYDYYEEGLKNGFDYLLYGYWHQSYAKAVNEAMDQTERRVQG